MTSVTIKLISPSGVAMDLAIPAKDDDAGVMALLDRAEQAAQAVVGRDGWSLANVLPAGPGVAELEQVPTFCSFPCSDTRDDHGHPTFIIAEGKQAMRREKQGDVWYSIKLPDGSYERVLTIPKGEKVA